MKNLKIVRKASLIVALLCMFVCIGVFTSEDTYAYYDATVNPLGKVVSVYDKAGNFIYTMDTTKKSLNTSSRDNKQIDRIVIHYWGQNGQRIYNVANWLCVSHSKVSAHYVVESNKVYNLVPEASTAWHAGVYDVNQRSIGIECRPEATDGDYETIGALVGNLWLRYGKLPLVPHRAVVATSCPGTYDLGRIERLANIYYEKNRIPVDWKNENGKIFLYSEGKKLIGLQDVYGRKYYIDKDNGRLSGKHNIAGKNYFFNPADNDAMAIDWSLDKDGTWYYSGLTGELVKGWQQVRGQWYYFDTECRMVTGKKAIDGVNYFFTNTGAMATGWASDANGDWYYAASSGALSTGWEKINDVWYYFYSNNKMATGEVDVDGTKYFFDNSGALVPVKAGWSQNSDGSWIYTHSSGSLAKGWEKIGGVWYYFYSNNKMATGKVEIDGTSYFFDNSGALVPVKAGWSQNSDGSWIYTNSSGSLAKDWEKIGEAWYYFDSSNKMVTGKKVIDGATYVFNSSGAMATGWAQDEKGIWYYATSSGALSTGWKRVGSVWYYFDSQYQMVTGKKKIDGESYLLYSSGAMATGWAQDDDGSWYYASSSGILTTGWQKVYNTWYYFDANNKMVTGKVLIDGVYSMFNDSGAWIGYTTK